MKCLLIVALFCAGAHSIVAQNSSPECNWEKPDTPEGRTKAAIDQLIILYNMKNDFSQGVLDISFVKGTTKDEKVVTAKLLLDSLYERHAGLKRTFFYFRAVPGRNNVRVWTMGARETPEEHGIDRTRLIRADALSSKLSNIFQ